MASSSDPSQKSASAGESSEDSVSVSKIDTTSWVSDTAAVSDVLQLSLHRSGKAPRLTIPALRARPR